MSQQKESDKFCIHTHQFLEFRKSPDFRIVIPIYSYHTNSREMKMEQKSSMDYLNLNKPYPIFFLPTSGQAFLPSKRVNERCRIISPVTFSTYLFGACRTFSETFLYIDQDPLERSPQREFLRRHMSHLRRIGLKGTHQ